MSWSEGDECAVGDVEASGPHVARGQESTPRSHYGASSRPALAGQPADQETELVDLPTANRGLIPAIAVVGE
jgi:hypothetical protein